MSKSRISVDQKAKALNRVFQYFYKKNNRTLLKASDFYIPFFFGKKKRLEEFNDQYIPLSVALFLESVRNCTCSYFNEPDIELIEKLKTDLLPAKYEETFDQYWNVINEELRKNPKDQKAMNSSITTLLLYKLYGPEASDPNEYNMNSQRHQVALDFQIGRLLFEYYSGTNTALLGLKDQEGKPYITNPKVKAGNQ